MTLLEAQQVEMPWGVHYGKTLREINASDRTYLTAFLAPKLAELTGSDVERMAWLTDAVAIVITEGASAADNEAQGELFGGES
jgi:hypothetical protein